LGVFEGIEGKRVLYTSPNHGGKAWPNQSPKKKKTKTTFKKKKSLDETVGALLKVPPKKQKRTTAVKNDKRNYS
jgi:hypothetical protein